MATALDPFSMFTLTTGPAFMSNSRSILNATLRHYYLMARFMAGKPMEQLLQGGSEIKDILYLEQDSNAEFYRADAQQFSYRNQQVGTAYKADWRLLENDTSWTDIEIGLNETGGMSDGPGTFHRFKYYRDLKMMNLWTTTIEKMEAQLFEPAVTADMEASTGAQPYSLCATISDNANRHQPGWTTVQGIEPDDYTNWDNKRTTYAITTVKDNEPAFWAALRTVHTRCKFASLPRFGAYGKASTSPAFIACSLWGLITAEAALQGKQDLLKGGPGSDPAFNGPTFSGVPFVYVDTLDTVQTYSTGLAADTAGQKDESDTNGTNASTGTIGQGPRFWFINGRCVNIIWHKNRMFHKVPPFHPDDEPFKKVLVVDNWYNVVNQNRRENGIVSPLNNVTLTYPAQPAAE